MVADNNYRRDGRVAVDPARLAACRLLYSVLEEGAYSNISALAMLENPDLDSRDRAFATAAVYGTISWLATIDWHISSISDKPINKLDPWIRTILRLGLWQLTQAYNIPESAAVNESVKLVGALAHGGGASYVNAVLRNWLRLKPEIPKRLEALKFGLPTWLYGLMKKWYGRDEAAALAEAYLVPQPWTTLRVNRREADSRELLNGWLEDGLEASAGLYLPEALRLKLAGNNLRDLIAWQDGLVTAQDEAAMLVSVIAQPAPNMEILDMCAAPGGKTTHLAELSDDRAAITALDLKPHRVELIKEQAERLNLRSITAIEADALTWSGDGRQFDLVLADVPCSGLGLLGRKPELRFNMSFESIQELIKLQREILLNAAKLVKAGGLLVYSTCTINPEENERQIDWLLTDTEIGKQFSACGFEGLIPGSMKLTDPEIKIQAQKGRLQLLPHKHRTDGFFISKLIRKFEE